jgi:serine/threonine protein kinase
MFVPFFLFVCCTNERNICFFFLDRYGILIGSGSQGHISYILDKETNIVYAGKRLSTEGEEGERAREEAKRGLEIKSPYTVQVFESVQVSYSLWIIMELCDGGTLKNWLEEVYSNNQRVCECVCFFLFVCCVWSEFVE